MAIPAGETVSVRLRLTDELNLPKPLGGGFGRTFARRLDEADEFYAGAIPGDLSADAKSVMRQSLAGLLRSKQFYD